MSVMETVCNKYDDILDTANARSLADIDNEINNI